MNPKLSLRVGKFLTPNKLLNNNREYLPEKSELMVEG